MRFHRAFRCALVTLVALSAAVGALAQTSQTSRPAGIPIEISSNKPFVPVRVNGSEPMWFVLDTGCAGGCYVSRRRAEQLGLEVQGETEIHTGAGEGQRVTRGFVPGVTIDVGDRRLTNRTVGVLPFDHIDVYEGRHLEGLLGYEFLKQFVAEIDYAARRLYLHDPATFEYDGPGRSIPLRLVGGFAVARGSITVPGGETIEGEFVVDTGVRTTLVLHRPFVEKHGLTDKLPRTIAGTIGGGMGGEAKGLVGRLESVRFGPYLIREPVAALSQDRSGFLANSAYAGIIGGQILRRCRTIFDYPHERMILEPYAATPAPYEYDMSGLFLIADGPEFKTIKVQSVVADSPAGREGLRRGDVIETINGRPAGDCTLERIRDLLRKSDTECTLGVRRGGRSFTARLKLTRLI